MYIYTRNAFDCFWKQHPALLYGLAILIGISASLINPLLLLFPSLLIAFAKQRAIFAYLLIFVSCCFGIAQNDFPELNDHEIRGTAHFSISSITIKTSHFGKQWIYKGLIKTLYPYSSIKNIPVTLTIPIKKDLQRPLANQDYLIEGQLKEVSHRRYIFILDKNSSWREIKSTFSIAEISYSLKKKMSKLISSKITNEDSAKFLTGLITGEFDDRLLKFHFSRFGLQHILAISGFHFAIFASILHFFLQFIFSKKNTTYFLLAFLGTYFIFLGFSPSILRAYIMILISLSSFLLERTALALNSLGIALIIIMFVDPLAIDQLGFQFSFATTASILFFYSEFDHMLNKFFSKHFLSTIIEMNNLNQHGVLLAYYLRQTVALSLAVNVAAVPLTLFHFEQFPYLSIIYNLFFPFMASISMLLLILGFIIPFCDYLNNAFTTFLLDFAYNMPQTVDYKFNFKGLQMEWLILYYLTLFILGVFLKYRNEQLSFERKDFAYI